MSICSTAAPKKLPGGLKPLAVRLNVAKALLGIGSTKFYELVHAGLVTIVHVDGMPLAEYASLERSIRKDDRRERQTGRQEISETRS